MTTQCIYLMCQHFVPVLCGNDLKVTVSKNQIKSKGIWSSDSWLLFPFDSKAAQTAVHYCWSLEECPNTSEALSSGLEMTGSEHRCRLKSCETGLSVWGPRSKDNKSCRGEGHQLSWVDAFLLTVADKSQFSTYRGNLYLKIRISRKDH